MIIPSPLFGRPIGPWRVWFAWKPIRTFDGELLWLRRVKRRRIQAHPHLSLFDEQWWQYARVTDCPSQEPSK